MLADVVITFLIDFGLAVSIGCTFALRWKVSRSDLRVLVRFLRYSVFVTLLSLLSHLYLFAATMLESFRLADVLRGLPSIVGTHAGLADSAAIAGACTGLLVVSSKKISARTSALFYFPILVWVLLCRSVSGHAANNGNFSALEVLQFLHLAGTLTWAGAVIVCGLILREFVQVKDYSLDLSHLKVLSRTCMWALSLVLTTGAIKSYEGVDGQLSLILHSPWGWILLVKIFVLLPALGLGAIHFLQLRQQSPFASVRARQRLKRTLGVEAVLLILVLAISALLASTSPPSV